MLYRKQCDLSTDKGGAFVYLVFPQLGWRSMINGLPSRQNFEFYLRMRNVRASFAQVRPAQITRSRGLAAGNVMYFNELY